jgi:curved DNA-binding protein CbpA/uncharacterized protein YecA (UPF0149 family)
MENLYDILGVKSDASYIAIKKSYFKLIRKFTPDKNEKKFKEVRYAYEVLSDENDRAEYDISLEIPIDIQEELREADYYVECGRLEKSIKIYKETLKHFDNKFIKKRLGIMYLENENFQKAIYVFKELLFEEPECIEFAQFLVVAYAKRGWINKAITICENLLETDMKERDQVFLQMSFAYFEKGKYNKVIKTVDRALNEGKISGEVFVVLLENKVMASIKIGNKTNDEIKKLVLEYIELIKESNDTLDDYYERIILLIMNIFKDNVGIAFHYIDLLEESVKTKKTEYFEMRYNAKKSMEFKQFSEDSRFDDSLIFYVKSEIYKEIELGGDSQMERILSEIDILESYNEYKFKEIEKEYPLCYSYIAKFVKKMKNKKTRKRQLEKSQKKFNEIIENRPEEIFKNIFDLDNLEDLDEFQSFYDDDYDDYDYEEIQEPYVKTDKKVGRNDPCPCGSGKKYKNCCANK